MSQPRRHKHPKRNRVEPLTVSDYLLALKRCLGQVIRELCEAKNLKPADFVIPGQLTPQTVRNTVKGRHSPRHTTLELFCHRLGTTQPQVTGEVDLRMNSVPGK
jgi:hypothetical protein